MKRIFDIVISCFLLVCLLPVILTIALSIKLNLGSPVLFTQKRPGRSGEIFTMIKFRTMKNASSSDNNLLSDSERLTRFGAFLRSSSLDELPELLNVLKGDMSIVGPRPLLAEYLPLYSAKQARRHDIRPGITGWAQVNGRNAISWEEKFNYDIWYIENRSFLLDIKIIGLTIKKVISREGISASGEVTTSKFSGNKEREL